MATYVDSTAYDVTNTFCLSVDSSLAMRTSRRAPAFLAATVLLATATWNVLAADHLSWRYSQDGNVIADGSKPLDDSTAFPAELVQFDNFKTVPYKSRCVSGPSSATPTIEYSEAKAGTALQISAVAPNRYRVTAEHAEILSVADVSAADGCSVQLPTIRQSVVTQEVTLAPGAQLVLPAGNDDLSINLQHRKSADGPRS